MRVFIKLFALFMLCGSAYSADYSADGVEIAFLADKEEEMVVRGDVDMPFAAEDETRFSARSHSATIVYKTVMVMSSHSEGVEARFTDCVSGEAEIVVFKKVEKEGYQYLTAVFSNGTTLVWHLPGEDYL